MKYNHTNRISLSCYEYAFQTWPLYEWSVKVSYTHSAVEISRKSPPFPPTHIHRDNAELCCDYIKKYSRPIGFLYFYRPINIILSADWSDDIKDITRRLPKSVPKLYNRPTVGRPTHRPMISGERRSADCRPMIGRHIDR